MKLFATVLALTTLSAFGATSGSLNLKGKVNSILSISVAPETIATTLPLDITQTNTKVATVNERSNSGTGYKVTISSANAGVLKRNGGPEVFTYSLKYDGNSLNLASPVIESHNAAAVNILKDVSITYTGVPAAEMIAGTYLDTVTFSIAVN